MYLKTIIAILFFVSSSIFATAQYVTSYGAAAEKYFAAGDYFSAATYYEKFLNTGKSKTGAQSFQPYDASAAANKAGNKSSSLSKEQAIYNLAESYRMLHYHEKALPVYAQALSFPSATYPLVGFHYGTTLKAMQRYEESKTAFEQFVATYGIDDIYKKNAQRELANLKFIQSEMSKTTLNQYSVTKASGLNADGGTYAPMWANDNTLWFTSTRVGSGNKNQNKIYQATYEADVQGAVSLVNLPPDALLEQGVTAMLPNQIAMFYTKWDVAKKTNDAEIYRSVLDNGKWNAGYAEGAINFSGSKTQQPFVTKDGKFLIFSSNRPGGFGGFDLWMAPISDFKTLGTPVNMGANINTEYDEQAPYYHDASKTFVFSSNGRVGMGGYDFFYSTGSINSLSKPTNFGYPVNSVKDDLYFTSKGNATNILESVMLSSDRDAACCLELFTLSRVKPLKQLTGKILSCETGLPLSGAHIIIMDTVNNITILDQKTDASGNYSYTSAEFMPLRGTASLVGYFNKSIRYIGPNNMDDVNFNIPTLCLNEIPVKAIKVENVYYDFDKATLQVTSFASLDDLVSLLNENPSMEIELSAHTDSKGSDEYNLALSQKRAQSVVDYLVSKGISETRLVARGYGETMPVAPNENADGTDNPEGRQQNRRTEFKVLKN